MSDATLSLKFPDTVLKDAERSAQSHGMTLEHWIRSTVEERLHEERQTAEFYRRRAHGGDGTALLAILDKAPDCAPIAGDEL
jgi:hypothetical protein